MKSSQQKNGNKNSLKENNVDEKNGSTKQNSNKGQNSGNQDMRSLGQHIKAGKSYLTSTMTTKSGHTKRGQDTTNSKQLTTSKRDSAINQLQTSEVNTEELLNEKLMKIDNEQVSVTIRIHLRLGAVHTYGDFNDKEVFRRMVMALPTLQHHIEDLEPEITLTSVDFGEPEVGTDDNTETEDETSTIEEDPEHGEDGDRDRIHDQFEDNTPEMFDEEPLDSIDLAETEESDMRPKKKRRTMTIEEID